MLWLQLSQERFLLYLIENTIYVLHKINFNSISQCMWVMHMFVYIFAMHIMKNNSFRIIVDRKYVSVKKVVFFYILQ